MHPNAQELFARHVYTWDDVLLNSRFADVMATAARGLQIVDFARISDVEATPPPALASTEGVHLCLAATPTPSGLVVIGEKSLVAMFTLRLLRVEFTQHLISLESPPAWYKSVRRDTRTPAVRVDAEWRDDEDRAIADLASTRGETAALSVPKDAEPVPLQVDQTNHTTD